MLMKGLDGQITTARTLPRQRLDDVGLRPRLGGTVEHQLAHDRPALLAHEIVLEVDPAVVAAHARRHGIVAHRQDALARCRGGGVMSAVICDSVSPARRRRVRSTCIARSRSPRRNQSAPPTEARVCHERPGLVAPAPALLGVVETGQHVGQRVDVRADVQAEMLEVVAGVGDDQKLVGRQHAAQAKRQLGAADTAGQGDDQSLAHRNMSSAAGRTSSEAGLSGAVQARPRTRTTGCASLPWP